MSTTRQGISAILMPRELASMAISVGRNAVSLDSPPRMARAASMRTATVPFKSRTPRPKTACTSRR